MWWRNDKTGHGAARLAALLLLGTIVALAAAWAAPRSSGAVEAWVKSPRDVTLRRVSIRPRLRLGQVDRRDASPAGRLRAARDSGVETIDPGARFTMLGLVCDPPSDDAEVEVRLRTSIDGRVWSRWYAAPLEVAAEDGQAPQAYVDALWTGEGRFVQVCAVAVGDHAPRVLTGVELAALDTEGRSGVVAQAGNVLRRVVATVSAAGLAAPAEAATEAPTWVTRAGWGADESLRKGSPVTAPVKMAFVHHTAGSNEYTRQQAAALVRGIYVYHTTGLGWSDIGYNFLIDRFGTIYVGRAGGPRQGVVGAHVYGFNTGSTGVSVMGTHTSQAPSPAVTDALIRLLAWKLELHGVDPLASIRMTCGASDKYTAGQTVTLPAISGHRDANYTECPGEALYAELGAVRTAVGARIGSRTGAPAPYALTLDLSAAEVVQGAKVTYSGTVKTAAGAAAGGTVTLQRRPAAGGDWSAWRTAKLSAAGSWSLAVAMTNAPREWQLRARMPGDGGANLTGLSPVRDLRVTAPAPATQETAFTISGRGWGHGVGLSQWGARGLALEGRDYKAILRHYYTGVGFSDIGNPKVRVLLGGGLGAVKLTCAKPYTVRGSADAVTIAANVTATTTYVGGKYRVTAGGWSRDFGVAVTFTPSAGQLKVLTPTDAGVTGPHRGTVRVRASGGKLQMINDVGMQGYLRGVVPHEMPAAWPAEALKAQACAARAYAEGSRRQASGSFDLYCDTRSQAYGGVGREDARTDAAVTATAGVVPSAAGQPIQAVYFSCSGGRTENVEYAWQTGPISYLKGVDDPYDDAAPKHTWGPIARTGAQMEGALGTAVKGSLLAVCPVELGVSPRIVKAAVLGTAGTSFVHGAELRTKLSLNSTWATFTSLSIAPAARHEVTVVPGGAVVLEGRIYPALADGAAVTLRSESDGTWRESTVATTRHSQSLGGGYTTAYSAYRVTVTPSVTTRYCFAKGAAVSPTTTIKVRG